MQPKLTCLSLAVLAFVSCEKSGTKADPEETRSAKPRVEKRADAPAIAENPAPGRTIDPPLTFPVDPSMIRPAGTAPGDAAWETLTAGEMIVKFSENGIARIPKDVSDKILADAANAGDPEAQVQEITRQAAAWHRINAFREDTADMPDHMRRMLLERLGEKHGESWTDMAPELDEQIAASKRVMELRLNGIPGMSPDESESLLIGGLEKYGPDYKAILSLVEKRAGK